MSNLHVVIPGKFLHLPQEIDIERSLWLEPGGVVDLDDEFVRQCVRGQEYKLAPAGDDVTEPSQMPSRRMQNLHAEFHGASKPKTAREGVITQGAERAAPHIDGIEVPDTKGKRSKKETVIT